MEFFWIYSRNVITFSLLITYLMHGSQTIQWLQEREKILSWYAQLFLKAKIEKFSHIK